MGELFQLRSSKKPVGTSPQLSLRAGKAGEARCESLGQAPLQSACHFGAEKASLAAQVFR